MTKLSWRYWYLNFAYRLPLDKKRNEIKDAANPTSEYQPIKKAKKGNITVAQIKIALFFSASLQNLPMTNAPPMAMAVLETRSSERVAADCTLKEYSR